ncbi:unnamed protein product [[Candida] boidinii]|uniref:Unnamed protein product n=1 Tax=Candida boidinii TaxID=5477 RepID=A0A9W6T435_CANBO|nr:unnamed protein product [[Candida] boidinii]
MSNVSNKSNDFPIYKTLVISDETVTITITSCTDTDSIVVSASKPASYDYHFSSSSPKYSLSYSQHPSVSSSDSIHFISRAPSLISEQFSSSVVKDCSEPMESAVTYTLTTVSRDATTTVTTTSCGDSGSQYSPINSQHSIFLSPFASTSTSTLEISIYTIMTSTTSKYILTANPSPSLTSAPESLSSPLESPLIPEESSYISFSEPSLLAASTDSLLIYQTTEPSLHFESQSTTAAHNSPGSEKPVSSTYFTESFTTCVDCKEVEKSVSEIPIDSTYISTYQLSPPHKSESNVSNNLIIPSQSNPSQNKELTRKCASDTCVSTTYTDYTSIRTSTEENESIDQGILTLISTVQVTKIDTKSAAASETSSDVFIFSVTSVTKSSVTLDALPNSANQDSIPAITHFLFSFTVLLFLI